MSLTLFCLTPMSLTVCNVIYSTVFDSSLIDLDSNIVDSKVNQSFIAFQVDFDRTKHLAESTMKQRGQEREKLIRKEREREESEKKKRELEELKREQER